MRRAFVVLLAAASPMLAAYAACGGDGGAAPVPAEAGGDDAARPPLDATAEARPYKLAASGAQFYVKGGFGIALGPANLAADADLFAIHQDFYGIPWDAFAAGSEPPASWTAKMDEVAKDARDAGKGVFLSLTPLNGGRNTLAARVAADGTTTENWAAPCYDFATASDAASLRTAYVRYVESMMDRFAPDYVAIGIEVNLFEEQCGAAWDGLVAVLNAAYDAAKAKRPSAVVFPTFQVDHVMGYEKRFCPDQTNRDACEGARYAKLAGLRRDRFAMSSYPYLVGLTDPTTVPTDWFSRVPARGGERGVISETGWLATPLVVEGAPGQCATAIDFSEATARAWLDRVLAQAQTMDLVTWISDRDFLDDRLMTDCPCTFDTDWCALRAAFRDAGPDASPVDAELGLKAFGAMGLRRYDSAPRTMLLDPWQAALR